MRDSKQSRRIRVLNGAHAILEAIRHQPLRCVFVGEMPAYLIGGMIPIDLDLVVIPQPGTQCPPNIVKTLCDHKSTRFRFCFHHNKLQYVDLSGSIPAGKQNWCYVNTILSRHPPLPKFELENIVENDGIPSVNAFIGFIDLLQDLLSRYNSLRTRPQGFNSQQGESWLRKRQIKRTRVFIELIIKKSVVPPNTDRAYEALSFSKRLIGILSGLIRGTDPTSSRLGQLNSILQKFADKTDNYWVNTRPSLCSVDDVRVAVPVVDDDDPTPSPSNSAFEEDDRDEADDWVEVAFSAGVVKASGCDSDCDEWGVDETLEFEILDIDDNEQKRDRRRGLGSKSTFTK